MADMIYVPVCSQVIKLTGMFHITPFIWDLEKNRVSLRLETDFYRLRNYLLKYNYFYASLALLQIIYTWNQIPKHSLAFALVKVFLAGLVLCVPTCFKIAKSSKEIVTNFNITLDTIKKWTTRSDAMDISELGSKFEWKVLSWTCKILSLTTFLVAFYYGIEFFYPCNPIYVGYWLSPLCRTQRNFGIVGEDAKWTVLELITRCIITIGSFFASQFWTCNELLLISIMMIKTHMISVLIRKFVRVTNNIGNDREFNLTVLFFREIQLILIMFREIYASVPLIATACGSMGLQVQGIYIIVSSLRGQGKTLMFFLLLSVLIVVSMVVTLLFVYGKMGAVYLESKRGLKCIKGNEKLMRKRKFVVFLRSCPLLKTHLGHFGFVEPKTPLLMERFVAEQTASLLILKK